jgi:hypothetical protein
MGRRFESSMWQGLSGFLVNVSIKAGKSERCENIFHAVKMSSHRSIACCHECEHDLCPGQHKANTAAARTKRPESISC